MEYGQTSSLASQHVRYLTCLKQWTKIKTWNLILQPGLHLSSHIGFELHFNPVSSSVQKEMYLIISSACVERQLKKCKEKMFDIKFLWGKEGKKFNFRCSCEHGLQGTGLAVSRTMRCKCLAWNQSINHWGDTDIAFHYCASDLWGCQRELCTFLKEGKKIECLGFWVGCNSTSRAKSEVEDEKVPEGGVAEGM